MTIKIKGVIGSDVRGTEFADMLARLTGDIEFEIDSPGGSVFHGISIFNAIKNYNRGKCKMHVVGDCSSMAAYIMLAGDGAVEFEPNSIVVLHNPWSFAVGDYRAMQKEGKILEAMSSLYAKEFVKKGLFQEKEIRSIMDEETWFIGVENLKKLGNVIGEATDSDEEQTEIKIAACRERMSEAKAKIRALKETEDEQDKIAALIFRPGDEFAALPTQPFPQAKAEIITESKPKEKGEEKMVANLEELKSQNPSIYSEAKQDGIKAEQARVAALMKFIDVDKQAVIDAIANGKTIQDDEFQSSILMAKIKTNEIKGMEDQNPGNVDPKEETHAPEQNPQQDGGEDEQKAKEEAEAKKLSDVLARMGISE